jgi:hypothetical protein
MARKNGPVAMAKKQWKMVVLTGLKTFLSVKRNPTQEDRWGNFTNLPVRVKKSNITLSNTGQNKYE